MASENKLLAEINKKTHGITIKQKGAIRNLHISVNVSMRMKINKSFKNFAIK